MTRIRRDARQRRPPSEDVVRQTRVSLIRRAVLHVAQRSEEALIIDIGLRGVFLERREPLPIDTRVRVSFHLPGNELPVEAECRVAWCHMGETPLRSKKLPPGLGLEFVQLDDDDGRRLHAFLLEHFGRGPRARQFARPWIDEDEEPSE